MSAHETSLHFVAMEATDGITERPEIGFSAFEDQKNIEPLRMEKTAMITKSSHEPSPWSPLNHVLNLLLPATQYLFNDLSYSLSLLLICLAFFVFFF